MITAELLPSVPKLDWDRTVRIEVPLRYAAVLRTIIGPTVGGDGYGLYRRLAEVLKEAGFRGSVPEARTLVGPHVSEREVYERIGAA